MMLNVKQISITSSQEKYLSDLMIDLGIFTNRKVYFKNYIGRETTLNGLTKLEASKMIELCREWKDNKTRDRQRTDSKTTEDEWWN